MVKLLASLQVKNKVDIHILRLTQCAAFTIHLCGININLQYVVAQDTHDLKPWNECQSLYSF